MKIYFKDGMAIDKVKSYCVCEYDTSIAHATTEDGAELQISRDDVKEIKGDVA